MFTALHLFISESSSLEKFWEHAGEFDSVDMDNHILYGDGGRHFFRCTSSDLRDINADVVFLEGVRLTKELDSDD